MMVNVRNINLRFYCKNGPLYFSSQRLLLLFLRVTSCPWTRGTYMCAKAKKEKYYCC